MRTIVVAPHPDDELLGCGGTLLRRSAEGVTVGWVLMTAMTESEGWSRKEIEQRESQIDLIGKGLGIANDHIYKLGIPTTKLDNQPMRNLIELLSVVFNKFSPNEVLLPHPGDAHSDHRITFEVANACTKWFRYPSIKRIITYETLSETEFGIDPCASSFRPNLFVNIDKYIAKKLTLLAIYNSEMQEHPFPRSFKNVSSLSHLRGSQMGSEAAESFQILKEIE